jgi:hypothetical protein
VKRALVGCECSGQVRDALIATGYWDEVWSADIQPSETPARTFIAAENRWEIPDGQFTEARHYLGDVRDLFRITSPVNRIRGYEILHRHAGNIGGPWQDLWDAAFLFPPCTHLSLAGAVWWKEKRKPRYDENFEETWSVQDEAASFFMEMVHAPAPLVAVENPRGDMTRRYRPPDQYVQPHMFGDPLVKATGLWLRGLPLLYADDPVEPLPGGRVATGGGSWRTDQKHGRGANNGHEDAKGRVNRQRERNRTLPGLARAMASQWTRFVEEQEGARDGAAAHGSG